MTPRFSGRTWAVRIINGESYADSRYSDAASFLNEGAKGRHHSRNFTALFTLMFISGSRGSARIERLPSARGPNSIRPWYQPRIFPCDNISAAVAAGSERREARILYVFSAVSMASSSNDGPRYAWRMA